jgi:hypothetical protein
MKSFDLEKLSLLCGGEYVLGAKDLHSHACYMVYGKLGAGEAQRLARPGEGYEEIICAVDGPLRLKGAGGEVALESGHAVHIVDNETVHIGNPGRDPVRYIIAGARRGEKNSAPLTGGTVADEA